HRARQEEGESAAGRCRRRFRAFSHDWHRPPAAGHTGIRGAVPSLGQPRGTGRAGPGAQPRPGPALSRRGRRPLPSHLRPRSVRHSSPGRSAAPSGGGVGAAGAGRLQRDTPHPSPAVQLPPRHRPLSVSLRRPPGLCRSGRARARRQRVCECRRPPVPQDPGRGDPEGSREPRSDPAPPVALSRPRPPGGGSGGGGAARRFRRGRGHGGAAAARAGGGAGGGQVPAPATGTAAALRPGGVPVGCRRVSGTCPWVPRVPAAHSPRRAPYRGHRLTPADDEMYQRTRVMVLEPESPNIMFIEGYSTRGFTISGDLVVGPCAVLPRSILQWNVGSHRDISLESLSLFRLLEPQIEILVLGTGDRVERLHPAMMKQMRERGIAVEVQDTANACATFNFLMNEGRVVAAGLIPPRGT
uniref:NADH dehydrogenase [ubiquinone] 1 alpha subcomplex assembly factor 3 n=2 Tax=Passerellidae TaxID=1729112 RepID=A0A8C5J0B6_JUNHY